MAEIAVYGKRSDNAATVPHMAQEWLLIETLANEPTVVAVGSQPKKMVPLPVMLHRNRHLSTIADVISESAQQHQTIRHAIAGTDRVIIAEPLILPTGDVHGAHLWMGTATEAPPSRPIVGVWAWNATTGATILDEGCLQVNGITKGQAGQHQNMAESFQFISANPDEADALAKIVTAQIGESHCATWTGKGDDGVLRRVHFAARILAHTNSEGRTEKLIRGLNINTAPTRTLSPEQQPIILAQQLLAAVAEPGTYRALVNLRTLTLLKWVDDPMPELHWEYDPANHPKLHPDDLPIAQEMSRGLKHGKTQAVLRLRGRDGNWIPVHATAHLALLNQHTTAALVTLRHTT